MEVLGIQGIKCPRCGSTDVAVCDSYTVIDGSSLYKQETRHDDKGPLEIAFRPMYQGNRTKYQCKNCGINFEYKIRSDEVDTIKER
jgi:DNA-directed RNA polymerase subunit RPC12/RpoP